MRYTAVIQKKAQHICIFGDPKSGKTMLAASVASFFRRVIWISMDNGHSVVFKRPKEELEKFEFIILPDTRSFPVAIDTCQKLVDGRPTHICNRHGQVECATCKREKVGEEDWTDINFSTLQLDEVVVFDHGSQLSDSAMNFVMKGKSLDTKPEWPDYAYQGALLSKVLMNIQQAPYNCIFITHTCETEMEDGSKRLVPMCGTVNFSRNMGKYFDHIIYCRVGNKKHAFGSATTYLASVLTGSREDIVLEGQNKEGAGEATRPSLFPFFEGKMDHLSVGGEVKLPAPSIISSEEAEEKENIEKISEPVLEEKIEGIAPAKSELQKWADVIVKDKTPEPSKEIIEAAEQVAELHKAGVIEVTLPTEQTVPQSPAAAAKARLAAMRAAREGAK